MTTVLQVADSVTAQLNAAEFDFEFVLPRAWELRGSFTFTDAAYIAVAEATGTAFVTLDERIARGPAVKCEIIIPPS